MPLTRILFLYLLAFIVGHDALIHSLGSVKIDKERTPNDIDNRIIGGTSASPGQFPYQVNETE